MTARPRISVAVETQKREKMAGGFYGSTEPYACALMNWERAGVNRQQPGSSGKRRFKASFLIKPDQSLLEKQPLSGAVGGL